ncbi:MAG TPA: hypothetical protein VGB52_06330 [Actinomycetota bacterium]
MTTRSIRSLPEQLEALDEAQRRRFDALLEVSARVGRLEAPLSMHDWLTDRFGSVEAAERQHVVKVRNRWTGEAAAFNDLRARRPKPASAAQDAPPSDDFCEPETRTPADTFGRISGEHSISAGNVAKYEWLHGLVILDTHDPLNWSEHQLVDAFTTARRWLVAANEQHPTALYPFVLWNCSPRAGASVHHPHLQVMLADDGPPARVEAWRSAAVAYRLQTGRSYLDDLWATHDALELAGGTEVRWLAHLTPVKDRELVLLARAFDDELAAAVWAASRFLIDELGVRAFNLALYLRPLASVEEDWSELPAIARIVDRGDPSSATNDIGAMELYGHPVIGADPFDVASAARAALG